MDEIFYTETKSGCTKSFGLHTSMSMCLFKTRHLEKINILSLATNSVPMLPEVGKLSFDEVPVVDPGLLLWGDKLVGATTDEVATFQKFCMFKRKNLDPCGGGASHPFPPLDPPKNASNLDKYYSITAWTYKMKA